MAKKKQPKNVAVADDWFLDEPLVANPAVPHPKTGGPRWLYWWVVIGAVMLPLALAANLYLVGELTKPQIEAADTYQSQTRPVARHHLDTWLAQTPAPVPGAQVLSWEGVDEVEVPVKETDPSLVSHIHRFAVSSGKGRFIASVTVAVSEGVPAPIGTPALTVDPIIPVQVDASSLWGARAQMSATSDIEEAVRTWSQALTSGDATKLRQAVGDPDLSRTYVPLQGMTWLNATITRISSSDLDTVQSPSRSVAFARVEIAYRFGEAPTGATSSDHSVVGFDVRIENADTGTPRVVAWGAAGTAPMLEAFTNAQVFPTMEVVTPTPEPEPEDAAEPGTVETEPVPEPTPDAGPDAGTEPVTEEG